MKVHIINNSKHPLPQYATPLSAGMDLRANIDSPIVLEPGDRSLIKTGIHIALPSGYEAQVRSRSGLSLKHGIGCLNGIGTIDADYTGEIGVILVNLGKEPYTVYDGDRVAQLVIAKHEKVDWLEVDVLSDTLRGSGGFGHTGNR